ncbi:MAG: nucleotidyl transferase AbiEii/AbiGii toxin family protein [Ignavibacteriae bacterium]|nr:nucleotidyl transferase AbiEii/AbiGii toxin family protein [Ignavibacteriota bacterium]
MNSGQIKLKYEVLDKSRLKILDVLTEFKDDFYLAGGTGLALQIGHRISIDFDFFCFHSFINEKLLKKVKTVFSNNSILVIQNELNTITILLDSEIKISFFNLDYPNILPLIDTKYFRLAQINEIGVMKLLALLRATYKDYVDIFHILKRISLADIISLAEKKHKEIDSGIYLKALITNDDIDDSPIIFYPGFEVSREEVFKFIESETLQYIKSYKK